VLCLNVYQKKVRKRKVVTDLRDDLEKQMSELRVHFYSLLID